MTAAEPLSQPSDAIGSTHRLGAVAGIDADILRGEVAGPVTGACIASVQVYHDRHMVGQEAVAGGAFVEIERLAPAEDGKSRHRDVHARRIDRDSRAAGSGENAAQ